MSIQWKDTIEFIPPITAGEVIKVYDGDTITIAAKLPFMDSSPLYRFAIRLRGIDSAEIKSKNVDEKQMAIHARDRLAERILHQTVILKNVATEKYGRILADVFLGELCINDWLIEQHLAVTYDGGTKQVWT